MLSKLDALRHVAMFASVSEPVLQEILAACRERVYMKGETLFVERDPPRGLIVLWRGGLKIYKLGDTGREQILDIVMPGGSVAELPLLALIGITTPNGVTLDSIRFGLEKSSYCQRFAVPDALCGLAKGMYFDNLTLLLTDPAGVVEPPPFDISIWALLQDLRALSRVSLRAGHERSLDNVFRAEQVWSTRQGPIKAALGRLDRRQIDSLITKVARADRIAKGSLRGDVWVELEGLLARIAGLRLAA